MTDSCMHITRYCHIAGSEYFCVLVTGSEEFSRVVPPAAQTGDGGEQPSTETCAGAGGHVGRAKPLL